MLSPLRMIDTPHSLRAKSTPTYGTPGCGARKVWQEGSGCVCGGKWAWQRVLHALAVAYDGHAAQLACKVDAH
eukprot:362649-Chlamydomonas_euryale.AAC.8